jgi:hypothetical protein
MSWTAVALTCDRSAHDGISWRSIWAGLKSLAITDGRYAVCAESSLRFFLNSNLNSNNVRVKRPSTDHASYGGIPTPRIRNLWYKSVADLEAAQSASIAAAYHPVLDCLCFADSAAPIRTVLRVVIPRKYPDAPFGLHVAYCSDDAWLRRQLRLVCPELVGWRTKRNFLGPDSTPCRCQLSYFR